MTLAVIGAGFGRTGTESLKNALEILGFGPCNHMKVILSNPEEEAKWRAYMAGGGPADWDEAFAGYRAAVDFPAAHYWRELSGHYPDAKVILSIRSSESWLASMENSMLPVLRKLSDPDAIGKRLMIDAVFGGELDDPDHLTGIYERHNQAVRDAIPPDRLLIYELGSGWAPICAFLGVPVPERDYPSGNTAEDFNEFFDRRMAE